MTDIELRKLKRPELLEMLLDVVKENEVLNHKVTELEEQLEDKRIMLNEAGTIAEASFRMNGVLEAAQAAAQQYLDNIKMLKERQELVCKQKEAETNAKVEQLLSETKITCEAQHRATADKCAAMEQVVQERCNLMKSETKQQCDEMMTSTRRKCEEREKEAEKRCEALDRKAEQDVESRWEDLSRRLEEFYRAHEGLRELLTASGDIQRD